MLLLVAFTIICLILQEDTFCLDGHLEC